MAIAAVSTAGDFIWAMWIPEHRPLYGLIHGTALFLAIGLVLGIHADRIGIGAAGGALTGLLAAASFYVLAPIAGFSVMFAVWFGVWIALGVLNNRLGPAPIGSGFRIAVACERLFHLRVPALFLYCKAAGCRICLDPRDKLPVRPDLPVPQDHGPVLQSAHNSRIFSLRR